MKAAIEKFMEPRSRGRYNDKGNRTGTEQYHVEIEILCLTPETEEDEAMIRQRFGSRDSKKGGSVVSPVQTVLWALTGKGEW